MKPFWAMTCIKRTCSMVSRVAELLCACRVLFFPCWTDYNTAWQTSSVFIRLHLLRCCANRTEHDFHLELWSGNFTVYFHLGVVYLWPWSSIDCKVQLELWLHERTFPHESEFRLSIVNSDVRKDALEGAARLQVNSSTVNQFKTASWRKTRKSQRRARRPKRLA